MIFGSDGGKWYGDDYYAISYHIELNKKLPCVFELCIKKAERVVRLHNDHFEHFLMKVETLQDCLCMFLKAVDNNEVNCGKVDLDRSDEFFKMLARCCWHVGMEGACYPEFCISDCYRINHFTSIEFLKDLENELKIVLDYLHKHAAEYGDR